MNCTANKLQSWKTKHLSKAGRVGFIQANLETMPAHTIQCFKLPVSTHYQIDKISKDFLWSKSNEIKGTTYSFVG